MPFLTHFILILFLGFGFRAAMSQLLQQFDIISDFELPALGMNGTAFVMLSAFLLSLIFPRRFQRPSDVFLFVYMVIVLIPKNFCSASFKIVASWLSWDFFNTACSCCLNLTVSRIKALSFSRRADKTSDNFNTRFVIGLNFAALFFYSCNSVMIYHSILHRTTIVVFYSVKSRARWACKCILLIFLLRPWRLLRPFSPCNEKTLRSGRWRFFLVC